MISRTQIVRLKAAYHALEEFGPEVVFVGGAVVSLYATRPVPDIRPTDDIDVLVEVATYRDYALLEDKLRQKGFVNDQATGVICRYVVKGITVDVMPTQPEILGFSNKWYPGALKASIEHSLDQHCVIRILPAPLFIATKMEAFLHRGNNDGRMSSDFEDIVFVLNHRKEIWGEMDAAAPGLRQYLQDAFSHLQKIPHLQEWISCHLDMHEQTRLTFIEAGIQSFVNTDV